MSWANEIAKLRRDVTAQIDQATTRLFGFTLTSGSSPVGDQDSVQTGDEPDSSGQIGQRPAQRVEPWGHRGRPPAKVRSLWLRLGSSNLFFIGVAPLKSYGPDDLAEGETALYSSADGAIVKLDKDGNIILTPKAGQTVQIAGSDYSLIKSEDFFTALKTFMDAAQGGGAGTVPIVVSSTGIPTGAFKTAATALWTALNAGTYKSTKAKNG